MSRITKNLAEDIAVAMTKHLIAKESEITEKQRDLIYDYYKSLFKEVDWNFAHQNQHLFVHWEYGFKLFGNGMHYESCHIKEGITFLPYIPCLPERIEKYDSSSIKITFDMTKPKDVEVSTEYIRLKNQRKDMYKLRTQLKDKIYNTLLAFGTVKRVRENFPEAAPHLPDDLGKAQIHLPMISVSEISQLLKVL